MKGKGLKELIVQEGGAKEYVCKFLLTIENNYMKIWLTRLIPSVIILLCAIIKVLVVE
jgi:hypothetical protein